MAQEPTGTAGDETIARLRTALRGRMKSRDPVAVSALRSALAAVANAEAVDAGTPDTSGDVSEGAAPPGGEPAGEPSIAGARTGLGAGEVERRSLSEQDVAEILGAEIRSRRDIAARLDESGHPDRAARLRTEADVIAGALADG